MGKTGKKIRESKKRMRKTRKWVRKSNKKRGGGGSDIDVGSRIQINQTIYEVIKILPEGSTCKVFKVTENGTNELYAVKAIYKTNKLINAANHEMEILNLLKKHCSEFILCIKDHDFTNQRYNYIVSEYIDNDLLGSNTEVTARLVDQLCRAVIKLHQLGIAHRDIKPDNIGEKGNNIKMIDFGNAIYKNDYDPNNYTEAGTYSYIYPELYKTSSPSFDLLQQSDVWSLGITIFNLIYGIYTYMFVNGGIMNIPDLKIPPLIDKFIEFAANPTEYKEKNNLSKVLEQEADKLFNEIMVKADALFEQGKTEGLYTINLREILTGKPENQKIYVPSTAPFDSLPVTAVTYTPGKLL
uniref:Protein kinase domain-containing protein n=1 Tax=viral metagenome TaxID=1070528 RepID=A0A6C0KIU6_9ZZZZ